MPLSHAILSTIHGIPQALRLAEAEPDELYDVAQALRDASEAVLSVALDVIALEEGRRIVAARHRASTQHKNGGPTE